MCQFGKEDKGLEGRVGVCCIIGKICGDGEKGAALMGGFNGVGSLWMDKFGTKECKTELV